MINVSLLRDSVITEARNLLGTKFMHGGRLYGMRHNGGGCDCLGLIIDIANKLRLHLNGRSLSASLVPQYGTMPSFDMVEQAELIRNNIIGVEMAGKGDVLCFMLPGNLGHLALLSNVGNVLSIIHAYYPTRCVVERKLDAYWAKYIRFAVAFDEMMNN